MLTCPNCASLIPYPRPNCPSCWATLSTEEPRPQTTHRRSLPGLGQRWPLAAVAVVVVLVLTVAVIKLFPAGGAPGSTTTAAASGRPASTSVTPQGGGLSAAAATGIARRWFLRRDVARYYNDDATLSTLETGVALRVDRAWTIHIRCGCEPAKHLHTLNRVNVVVPDAQSAVFLAHFDATASNGIHAGYTVVLARAAGIWKARLIALDGHNVEIHARAHPPTTGVSNRRSPIVAAAAYLQRWEVSGSKPPTSVTWTGVARSTGREWAKVGRHDKLNRRTHLRTHSRTVVERQTYTFAIAGGTLTCGVMDAIDVTSSPVGPLVQDREGEPWGPLLRPGVYPSLRGTTPLESCVISRPHHVRDLLSVYGVQTTLKGGPTPTVHL